MFLLTISSCWADVDQVQKLLEAALSNSPGKVVPRSEQFFPALADMNDFPVADAQEPDGGRMGQLGNGPQPLSRECPSSLAMDETDEIQVVSHGRELAAHGQQSEMESTIEHGPNFGIERACRTMDSQRAANSGLTGCLILGVHFTAPLDTLLLMPALPQSPQPGSGCAPGCRLRRQR